jgi:DNA repair photolyase
MADKSTSKTSKPQKEKKGNRSQSLSVYWGGFLSLPLPLELSLNWCSHACSYCYANLNSTQRRADLMQIQTQLSKYQTATNMEAQLLRLGYPINISGHTDAFATSNEDYAIPLLNTMMELDIYFTLCTKGGKRFKETVKKLRPSWIYFTVETYDDEVAKRISPNAPLPSERFEMIDYAQKCGHTVVVGINPAVPEWLHDDPTPLLNKLVELQVSGVLAQPLHFNNKQVSNMSEHDRAAIGDDVILRGKRRNRDKPMRDLIADIKAMANDLGLPTYQGGQGIPTDFFKNLPNLYPAVYPTTQDFVNHCYTKYKDGDFIYWEEYRDFFVPKLPKGMFPLRNHLAATQNMYWSGQWNDTIPKQMTYETLLNLAWKIHDIASSLVNTKCFNWAATEESEGKWIKFVDDNRMPIVVFTTDKTDPNYGYVLREVAKKSGITYDAVTKITDPRMRV